MWRVKCVCNSWVADPIQTLWSLVTNTLDGYYERWMTCEMKTPSCIVGTWTHKWPARVTIACVSAAMVEASANHIVRDALVILLGCVFALAVFLGHNRNLGIVEELGLVTVFIWKGLKMIIRELVFLILLWTPHPAIVHISPGRGVSKRFLGRHA